MATRPRRDPKPTERDQPAPEQPPRRNADGSVGFFEIMRRIADWLRLDDGRGWDDHGREALSVLERMSTKIEESGPVPERQRETLEALRSKLRELASVDLKVSSRVRPEDLKCVHPVLELLMEDNFRHLEQAFGRAVAEHEFTNVFKRLVRRRKRGRPPKLTLETVQRAKVLRDKGWSFARVGRELDMTGPQVRTALLYYFPPRKEIR